MADGDFNGNPNFTGTATFSGTQTVTGTLDLTSATVTGGVNIPGNVRASEGAGTTTLLSTDNNVQILNITADRTFRLPTAGGISAGQSWVFINDNDFFATIQSPDGTAMDRTNTNNAIDPTIRNGITKVTARIASPSTPGDWDVDRKFHKRRWVRRQLGTTQSLPTQDTFASGDMTISGLTVGKTYRMYANFHIDTAGQKMFISHTNSRADWICNMSYAGAAGEGHSAAKEFIAADTQVMPVNWANAFNVNAHNPGSQVTSELIVMEVGEGELEQTPLASTF